MPLISNPEYSLVMTKGELSEYVREVFPQADSYEWEIEELVAGAINVLMKVEDQHLRPGEQCLARRCLAWLILRPIW